MNPDSEKRKCPNCKCWRTSFTMSPRQCDACAARRRRDYLEMRSDPDKYQAWLENKRAQRRSKKAQRLVEEQARAARRRVVELDPAEVLDEPDFDPDVAAREAKQRQSAEYRQQRAEMWAARYSAGESTEQIAKASNTSSGYVYVVLKEHGVKFRSRSESTAMGMVGATYTPRKISAVALFTEDEICWAYEDGMSVNGLSKKFNKQSKTISRILTRRGIRIRSSQEQWDLMFKSPTT